MVARVHTLPQNAGLVVGALLVAVAACSLAFLVGVSFIARLALTFRFVISWEAVSVSSAWVSYVARVDACSTATSLVQWAF